MPPPTKRKKGDDPALPPYPPLPPRPVADEADPPHYQEKEKTVLCPFTVAIDTREQRPYKFDTLRANADRKNARIVVPWERMNMPTGHGDYSIKELRKIAIERKSKEDLYSSIGQNRENFENRLLKMQSFMGHWYSAILVEAEISEIVGEPPPHSKMNPKALMRTILAWQMRYPGVMWWFLPNREAGEAWTFRLLERFWEIFHDRISDLNRVEGGGAIVGDPSILGPGETNGPNHGMQMVLIEPE